MNSAELLAARLPDGTKVVRGRGIICTRDGWPEDCGKSVTLSKEDDWKLVEPAPSAEPETELWERSDLPDNSGLWYRGEFAVKLLGRKCFRCWRFRHPVSGEELTDSHVFRLWYNGKDHMWSVGPGTEFCYPFFAYAAEIFKELPKELRDV